MTGPILLGWLSCRQYRKYRKDLRAIPDSGTKGGIELIPSR